jgi:cytochrome P450 family 6
MAMVFEFLTLLLFSILSAISMGLYLYFTRNFKFWQKLGIPYLKPTPFVVNLKDCVFQKVHIAERLQQIYEEHSDKSYVGIFSFDKPSLLIRDLELVKNILMKDAQYFIDHMLIVNEQRDPLLARGLYLLKGERWCQVRTSSTPVFMMFYLVNTCGKELADCLHKATADGKHLYNGTVSTAKSQLNSP